MTRFARAKGSKSSNERVPEQATSWSQMKRDLHRESVRKAAEEQIERESQTEPQQNIIKNTLDTFESKITVREPAELVSFDDVPCFSGQSTQSKRDHTMSGTSNVSRKIKSEEVSGKKKPLFISQENSDGTQAEESHFPTQTDDTARLESIIGGSTSFHISEPASSRGLNNSDQQINGSQNRKFKDALNKPNLPNKRKLHKSSRSDQGDSEPKIGGNFKGYPVPEEDAETLTDAYNILRKEGLTHKQAMERIKPERRRAEKRLARLKSMICFRCRKPGHRLMDCPMGGLESEVCFKCGSTTHKYQDCKKKGSFVNAKCFICGTVGHLSAQCPENTNGVYPEGGECKICGEKSHLVKDCPQNRNRKEPHPGATDFDDNFDEKQSETVQPKRKKLKKVQF